MASHSRVGGRRRSFWGLLEKLLTLALQTWTFQFSCVQFLLVLKLSFLHYQMMKVRVGKARE